MYTLTTDPTGMLRLYVGCMRKDTETQIGFFNLEMMASSYPEESQAEELRDFLNENTNEIIDYVVYVMDATTGEMLWEKPSADL